MQTAFVVGATGEDEIDVDKFGRVNVEFRWDRRDQRQGNPTRRVRVSQGWAGAGYGFVALPRVGTEVIVSYLDGDPDMPIIVGRLHNTAQPTPLQLPEQKTQSIWRSRSSPGGEGYNMIRMEDLAGAEVVDLRAQRDLNEEVLHDHTMHVDHNQTFTIDRAQSFSAGSHSTSAGTISFDAVTTLKAHAGTMLKASSLVVLVDGSSLVSITSGGTVKVESGLHTDVGSKVVVDVHAPTVNIVAKDEVNINGGGKATVDSATTLIQGSEVQVNATMGDVDIDGGGSVNVSGDVINLNCD